MNDTARSYKVARVDDNFSVHLNIKWLGQLLILTATLVYSYYRIETRIGNLEHGYKDADSRINELLNKQIADEEIRFNKMEEQIKWYEKEFQLNPFSKKKKNRK